MNGLRYKAPKHTLGILYELQDKYPVVAIPTSVRTHYYTMVVTFPFYLKRRRRGHSKLFKTFYMREVLGIAKREFHESIMDLVKRKRLLKELEPEKPVEMQTMHLEDEALEDELAESHYSKLH